MLARREGEQRRPPKNDTMQPLNSNLLGPQPRRIRERVPTAQVPVLHFRPLLRMNSHTFRTVWLVSWRWTPSGEASRGN